MKVKNGKVKIELDIYQIIEFDMNDKQRMKLIEYILYSMLKTKNIIKIEKKLLDGILEVVSLDSVSDERYKMTKDCVEYLKNVIDRNYE